MGDFDCVLHSWEKMGDTGLNGSAVDYFWNFLDGMALTGMGFRGPIFTWNNRRNGSFNIQEQLDHSLASVR